MEEKLEKEKSLTLSEFFAVFKRNLIWVIVIIVAFLGLGTSYAYFVKKTTYTATVNISVRAYDSTEDEEGEFAEHLKYQYSALMATEFEKVIKTYEMQRKINAKIKEYNDNAPEEEKISFISLGALAFKYTEESAFFDISYSVKQYGGDANEIKGDLVRSLNFCIDECIHILNGKDEETGKNNYGFLADKLYVDSRAYPDNVGVNTGRTTSIIIAGLLGVLFSCIFIVIAYFVDDRITTVEHAEKISQQVVLSVIDISPNFKINTNNQPIVQTDENLGGEA